MTVNHRCNASWGDQYPCYCEPAIENKWHPNYHRLNGHDLTPRCEFCNAPALDDICESCYLLGRHLETEAN